MLDLIDHPARHQRAGRATPALAAIEVPPEHIRHQHHLAFIRAARAAGGAFLARVVDLAAGTVMDHQVDVAGPGVGAQVAGVADRERSVTPRQNCAEPGGIAGRAAPDGDGEAVNARAIVLAGDASLDDFRVGLSHGKYLARGAASGVVTLLAGNKRSENDSRVDG